MPRGLRTRIYWQTLHCFKPFPIVREARATSQAGLADLMADVPFGAKVVTVRRIASASPVWDNWWLLLALVLPLVAEWAIRRRVGFQ